MQQCHYRGVTTHETLWTISELADVAAAALADGGGPRVDGRVRDVPDARTIRWYQTTGLVDRPAAMRGRTALYGRRHLCQLVAIKRRQAEGLPLAVIQAELAGASDAELERIARVPVEPPVVPTSGSDVPVRSRFWAARPTTPRSAPASAPGSSSRSTATAVDVDGRSTLASDPQSVPAIRLAPGVLVVLDAAARTLDADELDAVRTSATPLLETLRSLGLLTTDSPEKESA